jgi:tripartite-type tricarboxylate transporter receptor subunit TctC
MCKHLVRAFALSSVLSLAIASAVAAQDYPTRPITIVLPLSAGSGPDSLLRFIAQKLSARLGQPVIVEPKPGAGTMIGASYVAKSPPDGYTLLLTTNAVVAFAPVLHKSPLINPRTDFVTLGLTSQTPLWVTVNPKLPIHSLQDLIRVAKESPGKLTYGHTGPGGTSHVYTEALMQRAGIRMVGVPYQGSGDVIKDVVAGHIDLVLGDSVVVDLAKSSSVRVLAISTSTRHESTPDVPTVAEAGLPGFQAAGWTGIAAPAKTPTNVVARLQKEVAGVANDPEYKDFLRRRGSMTIEGYNTPEAVQAFVTSEIENWEKVLQTLGLAKTQ